MLKKIFPAGVGNTPQNSFKLVIVAEGYLAPESASFIGDCVDLIEALLRTTPFNLTRAHPHWLSVYSAFQPSAQRGPAIDVAATAGRTAFESSLNSGARQLTVNQTKVNAYVAAETILLGADEIPLPEFCSLGGPSSGLNGTLIALLLPPIAGQPAGGEVEGVPGANDYHFVATSKDGLYNQVVGRGIARCLGLGDEFELAGAAFGAPAGQAAPDSGPYNLQYFQNGPPNPITGDVKWYPLFSAIERTLVPAIHPKANPGTADITIDSPPVTVAGVQFWEGGGAYRTQIWRTAHDCLMRRRIGDSTRPVRTGAAPFCPACRFYLSNVIW